MSPLAAAVLVIAGAGASVTTDVEQTRAAHLAAYERRRAEREELDARIERALCKNGYRFSSFSTPTNSRLSLRFSLGAGTRQARLLPDVSIGGGASWMLLDLNWTCEYPTREQLTEAGVPASMIIEWAPWSPSYQLAAVAGADVFLGPISVLVMPHLALRAGTRLSDFGYPFVDVTVAAGPTFSAGTILARPAALGAGISLSLGIWFVELSGTLYVEDDTRHFLVALSGRNRGALWQHRW